MSLDLGKLLLSIGGGFLGACLCSSNIVIPGFITGKTVLLSILRLIGTKLFSLIFVSLKSSLKLSLLDYAILENIKF